MLGGLTYMSEISPWIKNNYPIFRGDLKNIRNNVKYSLTHELFFENFENQWYVKKEQWEYYDKNQRKTRRKDTYRLQN